MANFATLVLAADTTGLVKGRKEIENTTEAANKNEKATDKMAAGFNKAAMAAAALGAAAVVAVGSLAFRGAIREAEQLERNMLRTNAIISATGGTAGKTAKQLHEQAKALALTTLASTEGVMKAQQTLLTFRNIRGEVFDDAIAGAMDLAAAMGTDLNSATMQLAKALEDPITGMSALTRSGTVFTDAQKEMVKGMVNVGDTAKAQQFILGELAAQYGGVAAKEAAGLAGAQDTLAQRQQEFLLALNDTLGLTVMATAANAAMAAGVLFLTDNMESVVGIIAAAAGGVLLAYTPAIIGATVATASWIASLITLRGALMATGVGALVVGAGLLIGKFLKLVESAGGFGKAMGLLGNVASAVFAYIVTAAQSVPYSLKGVWLSIQASFASMAMAMQQIWSSVISSIAGTTMDLINSIPDAVKPEMLENLGAGLQAAADRAGAAVAGASDEIAVLTMRSETYTKMAQNMRQAAGGDVADAIQKLGDVVSEEAKATEAAAESTDQLNDSLDDLGGSGGSAGKAAKALEKAATEAEAYDAAMRDAAMTSEDLGKAKANILIGGIDGVSNAFGDFVARGFKDFKGFAKSVLSTFTGMLSQMIAMAAKKKIMWSMGISAGGAGAAAAGQPGGGGGMGFGGIGTAVSTFGTAALGGFTNALGATMSGGLGMGFASIGGQVGAAMAAPGIASIAAALGAVALPLAVVVAAITFFKKKVELLDGGLRITATGMDTLLESFKTEKITKFWGLSKKVRTSFEELDAAAAGPIEKVIGDIQTGVLNTAGALGVSADAFDAFTSQITVSTKDMTDEQAQAAIMEALGGFSDEFAAMVPGLQELQREGETATGTLNRLATSLSGTNAIFATLGFTMFDASISGAALASSFVDIFGSIENLNAAATSYYETFYTEIERTEYATTQMRRALSDLGLVMPATIEGFRALVEQAERLGDTQKVGQLIQLSGSFANILTATAGLQDAAQSELDAALQTATADLQAAFAREQQATRDKFAALISDLQSTLTDARERLATSRAIADALTDALNGRVFPSVQAQRASQDQATAYLRSLVGQGPIDDMEAFKNALAVVADPSADTYETLEAYRRDFNITTGIIAALEKSATATLSADEQAVLLLEGQIADAQAQADAQVELLQQQLDALLGINDAIMTLADAMANFQAAKSAASGGGASVPSKKSAIIPTSFTTDAFGGTTPYEKYSDAYDAKAIGAAYEKYLGRTADLDGLKYYMKQAKTVPMNEIIANIAKSDEAKGIKTPGFAAGGTHSGGWRMVGENGPELEYTAPSKVVSNNNSRQLLDNRAVVAELQAIKPMLASIAKSTGRTAADIDKWDNLGLPGTDPDGAGETAAVLGL